MAIFSTYEELQAELQAWMMRTDSVVTARVETVIALAEARINRTLRTSDMEFRATASLTIGDAYLALPTSFKGMRQLKITSLTPIVDLEQATPDWMDRAGGRSESTTPKRYAIVGNELRVGPGTPDAAYTLEMVYFAGVDALSDSETSNWLLTRHPDVYLYASLAELATFTRDFKRKEIYKQEFIERLMECRDEEIAKVYGGSVVERVDFPTP